jgi:hypothetical protein
MGFPEVKFRIVETKKCPLYDYGDTFCISGLSISMKSDEDNSSITSSVVRTPLNKKKCKILSADLNRLIIQYERGDKIPVCVIECSGCTGTVRLEHNKTDTSIHESSDAILSDELSSMMHLVSSFAFFKSIDQNSLDKVVQFFRLKTFAPGDIIIRKGEIGGNFFIIASGSVNVLNEGGIAISTLSKGDVFGEMSLISGNPVGAKIKVAETATIVSLNEKNFKKVLNQSPSVQMYLARVLAKRLADSNLMRSDEIGLNTGRLESPGAAY